jgi:valyl-tRNA synthetase
MPFITEELWQRLPRPEGDSTPSIMLAVYPQFDSALTFEAATQNYELVLGYNTPSPSHFPFKRL